MGRNVSYLDLEFSGSASAIGALMDDAAATAALGPWKRVPGKEHVLASLFERRRFVFEHRGGVLPDAGVLIADTPGGAVLTTIMALDPGKRIEQPDQDALLRDLLARLRPLAAARGVGLGLVEVDDGRKGHFLAILPATARRALESFIATANANSLHKLDMRRWADFLIEVHLAETDLDPDHVAAWLTHAHGWPEHSTERLVGQLEFSKMILPRYDQALGARW